MGHKCRFMLTLPSCSVVLTHRNNFLDQTCYVDGRIFSCTACHDHSTVQMCHVPQQHNFLQSKQAILSLCRRPNNILSGNEKRSRLVYARTSQFLKLIWLDSTFHSGSWKVVSLSLNIQGTKWILSALQVKQSTWFNINAEISNVLMDGSPYG